MSALFAVAPPAEAVGLLATPMSARAERRRSSRIGVLAYPGIRTCDLSLCLDLSGGLAAAGEAFSASIVGASDDRPISAEDGTRIFPDWRLAHPDGVDLLVIPCGFHLSDAFGAPGAIAALGNAIRRSRRCLLLARIPRDARCAQILLQDMSTWSSGAFFEAIAMRSGPIRDGHLTWAVGESAMRLDFAQLDIE